MGDIDDTVFASACGYNAEHGVGLLLIKKYEYSATAYKYQLNPSKWPFRILSPMGEGALRGLPASGLRVADRFGLRGDGFGSDC
jgi:hypothetical protein